MNARIALAALLLVPGLAFAECYIHPDSGLTYCTAASECPANTAWSSTTQLCAPGGAPAAGPFKSSNSYVPTVLHSSNLGEIVMHKAIWSRNGNVITVNGAFIFRAAAAGFVRIVLSPPIATVFASAWDVAGTVTTRGGLAGAAYAAGNAIEIGISATTTADTLSYAYSFESPL